LLDEGESEGRVMQKCRISPKQAPFFKRQFKHFSRVQLERALENLFQLDWKLKTGQVNGPLAMEAWVIETTSR